MSTAFQLNGNRSLTAVIFLVSSFWQAGGGKSALAVEDALEAIIEAHHASCKIVESATGSGTYELYRKGADEKEFQLSTKAKIDVCFQKDRYSLRFDYETMLRNVTFKNADGTETKKISEMKPDAFFVIDDGTTWTEVKFSKRINPAGCSGDIWSGHFPPTIPWRDLAQLSKCINPELYVKNLGRDKLTVTELPGGIWRVSGWAKDSQKVRFEFDADSKVGLNVTSERIYNEPSKEPAHTKEITWKKKRDVWYGEQIVEVGHTRHADGTLNYSLRQTFKYDDFEPNSDVKPAVFTLAATGVPRGARFIDRRKDAPHRLLYWDGETLTPDRR